MDPVSNTKLTMTAASRVAIRVIRTDEEIMIARLVCRLLGLGEMNRKD